MQIGIVEGNATATIRHPSMEGWRLLVVQPINAEDKPDGDPVLVIDDLGAGHGSKVLMSNDGKHARELVGDTNSPIRWTVIGIVDE